MENNYKLNIDNESLLKIINEIYDGIQEDIILADQFIDIYKKEIENSPVGVELYGIHLSEMIKNKNLARERTIKLAQILKDRIKTKEFMDKGNGTLNYFVPANKMLDIIEDEDNDEY